MKSKETSQKPKEVYNSFTWINPSKSLLRNLIKMLGSILLKHQISFWDPKLRIKWIEKNGSTTITIKFNSLWNTPRGFSLHKTLVMFRNKFLGDTEEIKAKLDDPYETHHYGDI